MGRAERPFAWLVDHRRAGLALVALTTLGLGALAARVRPDYSVEQLFPAWDPARAAFDRYRAQFPREDARAVVLVETPGPFTPAGLERLAALEAALAGVPGVTDVLGPASVQTAERTPLGPVRRRLFDPALPAAELEQRRRAAQGDRLLAWNLLQPDGEAVSLLVGLDPATAASDEGRQRFVAEAEAALAREARPGERLVLSGVPVVRAKIVGLLARDTATLVPVAVGVVLLLLLAAFRSLGAVGAGLATILASLVWTFGVPGALGWPQTVVMGVLPVLVIIVSVSDTVHIVRAHQERLRAGLPVREAVVGALAESAGPCLVTELVLAAGFLSLAFVGIRAVLQFAISASLAMLLTWLANVSVLPLALTFVGRAPARIPTLPAILARHVAWVGRASLARPGRVLAIAAAIFVVAGALVPRLQTVYYVFDDLRPGSALFDEVRMAERVHGGLVLSAIHLEAPDALDPGVVRLADRAASFLRTIPEYRQVNSVADVLRPAHRLLGGEDPEGDGLPEFREGVKQELETLGDDRLVREFVSADRKSLAVVGRAVDAGSVRIAAMFGEIEAWVAKEQAGNPAVRITATGQMRVFKDLNDLLLGGLVGSFSAAVLVSLLLMSAALRSWRLGLVAMVPNVAPIVLVLAFMALAGIALTPVTVMVFSIVLVIADDDTIQFMVRFRRHYAEARAKTEDERAAHEQAAVATLNDAGPPMLVTGIAVSLGFLVLVFSQFLGPARLGALVAATLFAAVFADLYVSPVLLAKIRPMRGRPHPPAPSPLREKG